MRDQQGLGFKNLSKPNSFRNITVLGFLIENLPRGSGHLGRLSGICWLVNRIERLQNLSEKGTRKTQSDGSHITVWLSYHFVVLLVGASSQQDTF